MRFVLVVIVGVLLLVFIALLKRDKEMHNRKENIINNDSTLKDHKHRDCLDSTMKLVKEFEGYSDKIYVCPGGSKTIGYGFSYPSVWNKKNITKFEADSVLREYLSWCVSMAKRDGLCCERASAIGSFIYNLGYGNYKKSRVRAAIRRNETPNEILSYCYASGKKLRGLKKRRMYELEMYKSFKN